MVVEPEEVVPSVIKCFILPSVFVKNIVEPLGISAVVAADNVIT